MARIVMEQAAKQLGRAIVIENRGGAGGTLGNNVVAKAAPDGYTILVTGALSSAHALFPNRPYDTLQDLAPVSPLGQQPLVLVTAPEKGFRTLGDLIATARSKAGTLNFGSAGIGSASHFAAEHLRINAGFAAQHVPFRGAPEVITETMTGRVDFAFLPTTTVLSLVNEGKLRALAVSASKRAMSLPNVPTAIESGWADSGYDFWVGLFVPAKTPRDLVARLHREVEKALQTASVLERLAKAGFDPMLMSTEQFRTFFRADVEANVRLVKTAGIPTQ